MSEPPVPVPVILRRDALADGWDDDELARTVRAGGLVRVRRGAYAEDAATGVHQHALLVRATVPQLRRTAVVSHQSAAVLLGLPLWNVPLDRVHVTRPPGTSTARTAVLCGHVARLRDDEVVQVAGVAVTDAVRTVLDLARSLPHETAVVAIDAALHQGLVTHETLRARLFDVVGSPGSRAAARAIAFADARSESVGESRSRVVLARWKLPVPELQFEVRSPAGLLVARTDFAWPEDRLVGEFDGRVKYGRLRRPGESAGDAVHREKLREDAIRDERWGVLRWGWADLETPHRLAAKVRRAHERARRPT
ncbi:hypothetical protein [Blastococcus sp. LR1]|uniref:hypothetical protein n=1 Tax=Blastococcus sp. LR1 TaxID=2877000 RepID=UPI001CC96869|nr:hypothetical protein [Blastococcus sp. LR1]MCA0144511.1 hypothetical protein [Blastococcus sp. LR1]